MRGFSRAAGAVPPCLAYPGSNGNSGIQPHQQGFEQPGKRLVEPQRRTALNYYLSWTFAISSALTSQKPRQRPTVLDWAVFDGKTIVLQSQSANSEVGIKTTLKLIRALPEFRITESVCCMEHTGIYNRPGGPAHLLTYLHKLSFPLWLESSLQIKKAGVLQRGKTDAIDAQSVRRSDIAEYAYRFRDQMRLWQPPRPVVQKLAALSALRQRLLLVRQQLQQPITEQDGFVDAALQKQLAKTCQASLRAIKADLEIADQQITELIEGDDRLKELFARITSVPGVGPATATEVIVATNEFKAISDPRKLARATSAVMRALPLLNTDQVAVCGVKRASVNIALAARPGYGSNHCFILVRCRLSR